MAGRVLRSRGGAVSLRFDGRSAAVCVALAVGVFGIGLLSLTTGEYELSFGEVLSTLLGQGASGAEFIVHTLRLPRLLTALLVGAALGASGAVLQRLSGNPLGSPDVIGFTYGSATGALVVIVLLDGSMLQISGGALVGGACCAVLIYLLAYSGGVQGYRFILVGIGISAMALAANSYLITKASLTDALAAQAWLVGSVNGRGWDQVLAVGLAVAVLLPLGMYYSRRLALLELGDEAATGLGVGVERARLVLLGVSVGLAAVATAATGPIWFLALAAPQLARRLTRAAGAGLLPAALLGALLLACGDFAVQRLFDDTQLPVGTATGTLGGLYLIWLLTSEWRRGRA